MILKEIFKKNNEKSTKNRKIAKSPPLEQIC
jgi:hypothetical protein